MKTVTTTAAYLVTAAVFFGAAIASRQIAQSSRAEGELPDEVTYLPSAAVIKPASLGFQELVADYYWLKAIQYFGTESNQTSQRLRHLYSLVDLVTDLAPDFEYAYRFGAITMVLFDTNGDLAAKILGKGAANVPNEWRIPYLLGYIYYYLFDDPVRASSAYETAGTAAAKSGDTSMEWLHRLARKLKIDAGNPDLMLPVVYRLYEKEHDPRLREKFRKRLTEVTRARNIIYLEQEVTRFEAERGRLPRDLAELVSEGFISLVPPDFEGGEYRLVGQNVVYKGGQ